MQDMQEMQDTVSRRALYRRCKTLRRCKIHSVSMRALYRRCKHVRYARYCKHESIGQEMQACRICKICKQESRGRKICLENPIKEMQDRQEMQDLQNLRDNLDKQYIYCKRGARYARGKKNAGGARQGQVMYRRRKPRKRNRVCKIRKCFKFPADHDARIPLNSANVQVV